MPAGEDFRFAEGGIASGLLRLDLHLAAQPSERLRLFAEAALKAQGLPGTLAALDDLASLEVLAPMDFELVEAYADVHGFLLPQLDLRLGRQRIVWGTAERVSVVDNVNPLNLEDPWDYGRRLASDAVKLKAYFSVLTLEAVYVPYFTPALLPADASSAVSMPDGLPAAPVSFTFGTPGDGLWQNATLGARLAATVGGWDLAASYLYGRQSLPAAAKVTVLPDPALEVELGYPRQHVARAGRGRRAVRHRGLGGGGPVLAGLRPGYRYVGGRRRTGANEGRGVRQMGPGPGLHFHRGTLRESTIRARLL